MSWTILYSENIPFFLEMNVRDSIGRSIDENINERSPAAADPPVESTTEVWRSPGDYESPPEYESGEDDDMERLQQMGSNVDSDWDYTDVRTLPDREEPDRDRDRSMGYPERERDMDNPYDDPGFIDDYAWQYGGYTDETLPLAMYEDFYRSR